MSKSRVVSNWSIAFRTCPSCKAIFRFDELFIRLTMEPFVEKPIDNLASISFCTYRVRGECRRVWGCVTQIQLSSSRSRNCRNRPSIIVCNALTSALRYAEVKKIFKIQELNAILREPKNEPFSSEIYYVKGLNFGTLKLVLWSKVSN